MKNLGLVILVFVLLSLSKHKSSCEKYTIKENLKVPFGTIVKIKAIVIDGNELTLKATQDKFLLKVLSVNSKKIFNDVTMFYENETYCIPNSNFIILNQDLGKSIDQVDYDQE